MKRNIQRRSIGILVAVTMLFGLMCDYGVGVQAANERFVEQMTISDAGIEETEDSVSDADIEEAEDSVSDADIEEAEDSVSDADITETEASIVSANMMTAETVALDEGMQSFEDGTEANVTLTYGQESEVFASYDEVLARINELDSTTNAYVVTYADTEANAGSTLWVYDLPTKAASLTFALEDKESNTVIRIMGAEATYPLIMKQHVMLESTTLTTLTASGKVAFLSNVVLESLYILQPEEITVFAPIELQELSYDAEGTRGGEASIRFRSTESFSGLKYGKMTVDELVLHNMNKLNVYGTAKNPEDKVVMDIKNITATDKLVLHSEGVAGFAIALATLENNAATISWEDNGEPGKFHLTYGDTLEKFLDADKVFERISELNNAENHYVITAMKKEGEVEESYITTYGLPEVAGSLQIEVDNIRLENASDNVTYPVILDTKYASIYNTVFSDLHMIDGKCLFEYKSGATKLTMTNVTELTVNDEIIFDKVIYEDTKQTTFAVSQGSGYDWDLEQSLDTYGCLKIGELSAEGMEEIRLTYSFEDMTERTLVEIGQYTPICDLIMAESYPTHDEGYSIEKKIENDNSFTVSLKRTEAPFVVETADGEAFGTYQTWNELLSGFQKSGDSTKEYVITVGNVAVISTTMPQKAKKITLQGDLNFASPHVFTTGTNIVQPVDMELKNIYLCTQTGWKLLTWNANGKKLELCSDMSFEDLTGATELTVTGEFAYIGNMKNIGTLTIEEGAKLRCYSTASGVGKMYLNGEFAVTGARTIVLPDIVAGEEAAISLEYYEGDVNAAMNAHNLTLNGSVTGNTIAAKMILVDNNSNLTEEIFPAGTKLFTAPKCTGNQFTLKGEGMICYKQGNAFYAGQETLELFIKTDEDTVSLGQYRSLADVKAEIAGRKQANATYIVDVKQNLFVAGALPLPTAGTYKNIIFTGKDITITGAVTLTGNTEFQNVIKKVKSATDQTEQPISISLGKYNLTIGEGNEIDNLASITGTKGSSLTVGENVCQEIAGAVTNVENLQLDGTLAVWGNITVTNILAGAESTLQYDIEKTQTINGVIQTGKVKLVPYKGGNELVAYEKELQILDNAPKLDVQTLQMNRDTDLECYRSGKAIKLGTAAVTVFSDPEGDWKSAEIDSHPQFVTLQDAVHYIQNRGAGTYAIRLESNVPSSGKVALPSGTDKTVMIGAKNEGTTLNFTGAMTIDGSSIIVENVILNNQTKAGVAVTLKNGATLTLRDVKVGSINAATGTTVIMGNGAVVQKALSGTATLKLEQDTTVQFGAAVTVQNFQADRNTKLEMVTGKLVTIKGNVNIPADACVTINHIDKDGKLLSIKEGTKLVTSAKALAGQFRTDNIMTGTEDVKWLLTKSDTVIKTAKLSVYICPVDPEIVEEKTQFASFNEAKEYIATKEDDYIIQLLSAGTGADLSDLPKNVMRIEKSEQVIAESVKLTSKKDICLTADLELYGVVLESKGKTLYANGRQLLCNGNAGLTVAKVRALDSVTINDSAVIITGSKENQINYVHMGVNGSMMCPLYTGFLNN